MTIELSEKLTRRLESASREEGVSPSQLAERFIDRALARVKLEEARRMIAPLAKKAGFRNEDDVFKAVS